MTSRTRYLGLALVVVTWWLVGAVTASTEPLACFDITTTGANITHVLVDLACTPSPSGVAITVDGEPVTALHTDDGPCESLPRAVWFPLQNRQDAALVCVTVQGAGLEDIQVYGKAGDECIAGTGI